MTSTALPLAKLFRVLPLVLFFTTPSGGTVDEDRKRVAVQLAKEIEHAQLHKIYVADFREPSGERTDRGCYYASVFSTNLKSLSQGFEVVNRIEAEQKLEATEISPSDLRETTLLAKAASALNVDAVLVGSLLLTDRDAVLSLRLVHASSGKEIARQVYRERLPGEFKANFPPATDQSGHIFYFAGLDGITTPKCKRCPNPDYTTDARSHKFMGIVITSALITPEGTIKDALVLQHPAYGLAEQCLNAIRRWRFEPARDGSGAPVPVRVPIQTSFRLY